MAEKKYGFRTAGGGSQLVREGLSAEDLFEMSLVPEDRKTRQRMAGASGSQRVEEWRKRFEAENPETPALSVYPGAPEDYAEKVRGRYAKGGLVKKQKPKPVMKMAKGGMMCSPRKKMAMGGLAKGCKRSGVK